MGYTIAVTGKGGVGKTTLTGLLIINLIKKGCRPILAVDADPNLCLDAVLGVSVSKTIGGIREEARRFAEKGITSGISKQQFLQLKISESLVETDDFDLIAMGRPEGPGCYCYANNVLKEAIAKLSSQYPYIVLDNEAGLENLSRRVVQKVDLLVMVTDPSNLGFETIIRLHALAREMKIQYSKLAIMINRLHNDRLPGRAAELKMITDANIILSLPDDLELAKLAEEGKNLFSVSDDNPVSKPINAFISEYILQSNQGDY
jgi:CO dehydrogenase maturation factor